MNKLKFLLSLFIFLFFNGCDYFQYRIHLKKSINLSYDDSDILFKINLVTQVNRKNRYCGVMTYKLLSEKIKEVELIHDNDKSGIYPDTIADVINFWDRKNWDLKGYRQDKVCIDFGNSDINWQNVKILAKDIPNTNKMSIKTACSLVSEESEAAKTCKELKKNEKN